MKRTAILAALVVLHLLPAGAQISLKTDRDRYESQAMITLTAVVPAGQQVSRALRPLPYWKDEGSTKGASRFVLPAGEYDLLVEFPPEMGGRFEKIKGVRVNAGAETAVRTAVLGRARVSLLDLGGKPLERVVTLVGPGGTHRARTNTAVELPTGSYRVRLVPQPFQVTPRETALVEPNQLGCP